MSYVCITYCTNTCKCLYGSTFVCPTYTYADTYIERNSQVQQRMGWIIWSWFELTIASESYDRITCGLIVQYWSAEGLILLKDSLRPTVLFEWELYRIVIWEPFMTGNFYAQLKATNSNNTSRTLSEPNLPNFGGNFSTSSPSMPTSDPCGSCCNLLQGAPYRLHYIWAVQVQEMIAEEISPHEGMTR